MIRKNFKLIAFPFFYSILMVSFFGCGKNKSESVLNDKNSVLSDSSFVVRYERNERNDSVYDREVCYASDELVLLGDERLSLPQGTDSIAGMKVVYENTTLRTIREETERMERMKPNCVPAKVVMMLGCADLDKGRNVNDVYLDYVDYIEKFRTNFPQTELVILSFFPVGEHVHYGTETLNAENVAVYNLLIKMYTQREGVTYLNLFNQMRGEKNYLDMRYDAMDGFHLLPTVSIILENYLKSLF